MRKRVFIKHNIVRHIDSTTGVQAVVAFIKRTITNEDIFFIPESKFMFIIWPKIRLTSTTKHSQNGIIRFLKNRFLVR